ncbi:MAG: thioredoxin [Candidatus Cloacimonadaceae bacterium]
MAFKEFTQENFEAEVLKSELPVLVDFWAPWCGPCKAITPVLEKIAAEFEGKVIVGKLNVDEAPAIASQYSIMSIPSLLFYVKGQVKEQIVGLTTVEKIKDKLIHLG